MFDKECFYICGLSSLDRLNKPSLIWNTNHISRDFTLENVQEIIKNTCWFQNYFIHNLCSKYLMTMTFIKKQYLQCPQIFSSELLVIWFKLLHVMIISHDGGVHDHDDDVVCMNAHSDGHIHDHIHDHVHVQSQRDQILDQQIFYQGGDHKHMD